MSPRRPLSRRRKLLFACVPLLVLVVVGEFAARSFRADRGRSPFDTGSYRDQRIDLIRRGYPAQHDPRLGYVPRANYASADNRWGAMVSIDARSLRNNGGPRPAGERGVLAVGDSFTFGDEVADDESWPAQLERILQRPVWNGGVFGYSFAQTVLRAEQLLDELPADTLLLGLIPDDLKRCEMSRRFTEIPWYDLVDGELVLRNVPVPDTAQTPLDRQFLRTLLGHSALCDLLAWNLAPRWWVGIERETYVHPRGTGVVIGQKLLDRLAARCRANSVRLLVVLQDAADPADWSRADAATFLAHAAATHVATLDLITGLDSLAATDPTVRHRFFGGHMSAAGNAWVATRIAAALATGK